jgi:pimeloyl-ACP methyl ester carboxylesterase
MTMIMNRRTLLSGSAAAALGRWGGPVRAAPYASRRLAGPVRGEGRDVVLIPGLASGPGIWNGLLSALPGYRFHLIHVRGFAGLPAQANQSGPLIQPLADEIARYITAAGLNRPPVIGHSMGGTLALKLGLSGRVGRVMVVDMLPAGAAMVGGTASGLGFLADQLSSYLTGTAAGRRYLAQIVAQTPGAKTSDPDVIANALRDLANVDLGPQLSRLTVPLHVVFAVGSDAQQAAAVTRRFREAYAGAKGAVLKPIGPSGHMVMADQPARFLALCRMFLAG